MIINLEPSIEKVENEVGCYKSKEELWFTREQIEEALGYENPANAIQHIHNKHKDAFIGCFRVEKSQKTYSKNYENDLRANVTPQNGYSHLD